MKASRIVIAVGIALAVLAGAHIAVYEAIVSGLSVTDGATIVWLRISLAVLCLSFICSLLLTRRFNSLATRALYRCSAAWLGLAVYLFFASILVLICDGLFGVFGPLTVALFVIAAGTGIYGIINARILRATVISVHLPAWRGKKAVFVSDIHLGQVNGEAFAAEVAGRIAEIKPDIVLIGGDIYDGVRVDAAAVVAPFAALSSPSLTAVPLGTYFIMGNHEEFSSNEKYKQALEAVGIRVLIDQSAVVEGVRIVGVDYRTTETAETFRAVLDSIVPGKDMPSILLKHTPFHIEVGAEKGFDLQLSGHTHKAQIWPFSLITRRIFKGFDYGLKLCGAMQVYTSSGAGTFGPPLRVGTRSEIVVIEFI